jgi:hypothetical protein
MIQVVAPVAPAVVQVHVSQAPLVEPEVPPQALALVMQVEVVRFQFPQPAAALAGVGQAEQVPTSHREVPVVQVG